MTTKIVTRKMVKYYIRFVYTSNIQYTSIYGLFYSCCFFFLLIIKHLHYLKQKAVNAKLMKTDLQITTNMMTNDNVLILSSLSFPGKLFWFCLSIWFVFSLNFNFSYKFCVFFSLIISSKARKHDPVSQHLLKKTCITTGLQLCKVYSMWKKPKIERI